ncbi:hypothetical protein [Nonomuraea sp. NPDC049709]|uniref:hypothetical protein n=1 Tax=Nonomuraea sp. NPDC049709 TaxID=3154736 RepID=UPI003437310A
MTIAPENKLSRAGCLLRVAAFAAMPFLLLYALAKTPMWINDYRVGRLMDRILEHPLPATTAFGLHRPHAQIAGDSTDCSFDIRFDLYTDLPTEEVLDHYRKVDFTAGDETFSEVSIGAWVEHGDSTGDVDGALIISLGGYFPGGNALDPRCW